MAAFPSSARRRRRGLFVLSVVAVVATLVVGVVLWQAVALSSLGAVAMQVEQSKPLSAGLRLALIAVLAVGWRPLGRLVLSARPASAARLQSWMSSRWRVVGWLLLIELLLGQNLIGRFVRIVVADA